MICGLRFRLNVIGYSVCLSASLSFIFHLRSDQVQLNSRQEYTHSIKFPSGSRQYTLLILPLAPVLITMPSSLFSLPRSTNSTPASINFFLTSLTSSSVKKHKSALPSLTRRALGSNSCHSHISSLSRANTNIDSSWSRMWVAPEAGTFPNSCKFTF